MAVITSAGNAQMGFQILDIFLIPSVARQFSNDEVFFFRMNMYLVTVRSLLQLFLRNGSRILKLCLIETWGGKWSIVLFGSVYSYIILQSIHASKKSSCCKRQQCNEALDKMPLGYVSMFLDLSKFEIFVLSIHLFIHLFLYVNNRLKN